ncbi:MAG: AAA family ATPase [Akkermansiaceae bacterium]|nr:AAA family ATPase [Akkermansiaceae bacterium]
MVIEKLRIENFKALREVTLRDLPNFAVFVGKNGAGKTTLFRVFAFLKDCLATNVRTALQREGGLNGFREVITRGCEGESIELEIKFRLEIAGHERLVTYLLEIGEDGRRPFVKREILRYKRARHGAPFHFIDFRNGEGYAISNEEDFDKPDEELEREYQALDSPDLLAIKALGQFQRFKAANAFRQLIENWHISDFHITSARGKKEPEEGRHLSSTGDNLPVVARRIRDEYPETWSRICRRMEERVPGVKKIVVQEELDGGLLVQYQDGAFKDPFFDRNVSDGTIKMFSYLILLNDPLPHKILCVEEPENQLYPELMIVLAEEFIDYAERGGQVLVSTHSPQFLNAISGESIFVLEKEEGVTKVYRAMDDPVVANLVREGDHPGYLWQQGSFEGMGARIKQEQKKKEIFE